LLLALRVASKPIRSSIISDKKRIHITFHPHLALLNKDGCP
jgi:hypothetical protein